MHLLRVCEVGTIRILICHFVELGVQPWARNVERIPRPKRLLMHGIAEAVPKMHHALIWIVPGSCNALAALGLHLAIERT